jgi:cytochrome c553
MPTGTKLNKKMILLLSLGAFLGLIFVAADSKSIAFESRESKNNDGGSVFNQIKMIWGWDKDIWLMRQSHHGFVADTKAWDRLAIVVDKTKSPAVAEFYQLEATDGELAFDSPPKAIPFKARCFACHANGPRAIRPNWDSSTITPDLLDHVRLAIWNVRIKLYGHVNSVAGQTFNEGVPFRSTHAVFSRPLDLAVCQHCHSKDGIRNEILLEQVGTAYFLVKNGIMPPFPFRASENEVEMLKKLSSNP